MQRESCAEVRLTRLTDLTAGPIRVDFGRRHKNQQCARGRARWCGFAVAGASAAGVCARLRAGRGRAPTRENAGACALTTSEGRALAVIRASFSSGSFRREVISAWLNFYVLAQSQPQARRLLAVYQRRIVSNLRHALRPLLAEQAHQVACSIAAMIDGAYLHAVLGLDTPDGAEAARQVEAYLTLALEKRAALEKGARA